MRSKVRTLLFSTLYPSSVRPGHGIFVETRLRELLKTGEVESKVIAPVPWFPLPNDCFGVYGKFASTPEFEHRNGVDIDHPRYFLPPKVGMHIAPYSLALGALPAVRRIIQNGFDFDLIDAHYYYPDGVAAGILAKWLGKPFVVTARGSDINLISKYRIPRSLMRWAAGKATASITVSRALGDGLAAIGADVSKINVFRNGVDLDNFSPIDQKNARSDLGWPDGPTLISVGNLVENKGHHLAIEALKSLQNFRLVVVGDGPERIPLERLSKQIGVADRVSMVGRIAQNKLPFYYSAADILVLASRREGWANVLLESMACGTPVVATAIPGTSEVVLSKDAGCLVNDRDSASLAKAVSTLYSDLPERTAVRRYAEKFDWNETSRAQLELFSRIKNA